MNRYLANVLLWLGILTGAQAQQSSFYCCDFSTEAQFTQEWTTVNANKDYSTWQYNDWMEGADGELGCANCGWSGFGNNDYLVSQLFTLKAGTYHAVFFVRSIRSDVQETFELCYGPSATDMSQMSVIKEDSIMSLTWRRKVINFDIPADGDYRLAFHCTSRGNNFFIDDICFGEGTLDLSPRIVVRRLLLPDANCDLTDATPVGVVIANEGTDVSSSQTLALAVDGSPYVEQTFDGELALEASRQVYFDATADLLDVGSHVISVIAKNEAEADTTDFTFRHIAPVTSLPFYTNFSTGDDVSDTWTSRTNCWRFDGMAYAHFTTLLGPANALYSACMHLTGDIRLKFAYGSGGWMPDKHFTMKLGRAGTSIDQWDVVYDDPLVALTPTETEVVAHIDSEGDYTLALIVDGTEPEESFFIYYLNVYAVYTTDLQLFSATTPLVPYLPQAQYNAEGSHELCIVNHGLNDVSQYSAALNIFDQECFSQHFQQTIAPGDTVRTSLRGTLPAAKAGDEVSGLNFTLKSDGDTFLDDNRLDLPVVHLTDSVFATELLPHFAYGVGSSDETFFGNVFTLATPDTLTSIGVGLAKDISYQKRDLGVAVYEMEADGLTVGRRLWHSVIERGADEGIRLFFPAPMILEPGKYFVEVHQYTWNNIGVGIDYDTDYRLFYQRIPPTDGTGEGRLRPIEGGGALAVRAYFGHDGEAWQKDAGVVGFTQPVNTSAVFGADTVVAVVVRNYGHQPISAMQVRCTAAGPLSSVQELTAEPISLLPYEELTLTFRFDLSQPGTYAITATTMLDGDEHPQNDAMTLTLTSQEILSPYTLDFEGCNDNDHGHSFNPQWWSVDRANRGTDGWAFYDYPMRGESVGFVAFDPLTATPAILPETGCYPHSGQRLGIAYCTLGRGNESDVWLVSPSLQLGKNPVLTFWVKNYKDEGWNKAERYRVLVSTTTDDFDSFTPVGGDREVPFGDWQQVSVDLSDYADQPVAYVALQYVSNALEGFFLMVDDINVSSELNDGVETVADDSRRNVSAEVYDLQGRRVNQAARGIYIRSTSEKGNRQKVVVK